jgi:FtsP/CotA-like multicopper oxidase with cupredoxin domain
MSPATDVAATESVEGVSGKRTRSRRLWRDRRAVVASVASLALVSPLVWMSWQSRVPETVSVMDMGYPDYGGGLEIGPHADHTDGGHGVSVTDLTGPRDRRPDVDLTLVARRQRVAVADGVSIDGFTLNGQSPGPTIRVRQGELLRVTLANESVADGVTLHWHGVDLPNAEDGVAGVTQDAVLPGQRHVYQFVADDPGTYWYHSHQVSHVQVRDGLFGVLVVEPSTERDELDVVETVHTYRGQRTASGSTGLRQVSAEPGTRVRVRVVNTDDGPLRTQVIGADYRLLAIDARNVAAPKPVTNLDLRIPAGGRADLGFITPADGSAVRVELGIGTDLALIVGLPTRADPDPCRPAASWTSCRMARPDRCRSTRARPTGSSPTPSAGSPAFSMACRASTGPSTGTSTRMSRCSWWPTATWCG